MIDNSLTLLINGVRYGGWSEVRVTHAIEHAAADFDIAVSERWTGQDVPWPILPFDTVQIFIGADLVLTGYVDSYTPQFGVGAHGVRIAGRSKTEDLVDCTPDIASGQFVGYSLSAIARSLAALFATGVVVETPFADEIVADAIMERGENAHAFLLKQATTLGVLMTTDEAGNLVLTAAGQNRATDSLVQGVNLTGGHAKLTGHKRFSEYVMKGQSGLGIDSYAGAGGIGTPSAVPATVQTEQRAVALDTGVPRFRPLVKMSDGQLDQTKMQAKVDYLRNVARAKSREVDVDVVGWRQSDGSLWRINTLASITSSFLGLDQELLIVKREFSFARGKGHVTKLTLGPVEGYTPDPASVKHKKAKAGKGGKGGPVWDGAGG